MMQDAIEKIKEVCRRLGSSLTEAKDLVVNNPGTVDEIIAKAGGDKINLEQVIIDGKLQFDLWRNGHWIGMSEGRTPEEARKMLTDSGRKGNIIMLPFYGLGTSEHTYKMLMGV